LRSGLDKIQRAIQQRQPVSTERVITEEKPGETRYLDIMVYPLDENSATGAVIRIDDVTNRVRIEQIMVQTEKMMSVGGLAAGMAHEINNPLSAILQSCQNIERRLAPERPANVTAASALGLDLKHIRRYLDQRGISGFLREIQVAGTRAARIVADMLSFSRRSHAEFEPARIDEMLETVVRLAANDYDLKRQYDFRHIEIVRDYDDELNSVYCDRTQIEQVFLNVIKNAAQAMGSGGRSPHRITLRTRREGDFACVEIEDNGPGMDRQQLRHVFEPFYTTKPVGIGTGLGMSVAYFIVTEQHHGSISVSSNPGRGTCFVIRLPVAWGSSSIQEPVRHQ
jgi:signal transduction histidine kinase